MNWTELSGNANAIYILEQNVDRIDWDVISRNPSLFEDEDMGLSSGSFRLEVGDIEVVKWQFEVRG